ncbi:hypothetical protein [Allostreptomyces psammosilenae]|uniref:Uncharacterized protein n=1 Tax=Allostreptomyces psammosilenae TaxID=1892865 RepID=A0A853A379_9ACTN|nr:hypothetical protein [Allostreptomyces psammosilenae]NYI05171.1 hypothetical protein [Allostreptomyces psammosilenae]
MVNEHPGRYAPYVLEHAGHRLAVEVSSAERRNTARLLVDGHLVDERTAPRLGRVRLRSSEFTVLVEWWWLGRVATCALLLEPPGDGAGQSDGENGGSAPSDGDGPSDGEHGDRGGAPAPRRGPRKLPFEPPAGSRASRLARLKREHPALYASRHVAIAVLEVGLAVLGVGALLRALLPRIDWSFLPEIDLSWIPRPHLDLPNPLSWIPWPEIDLPDVDLPDIDLPALPGWISEIMDSVGLVIPILIAVAVAVEETRRRRRVGQRAEASNGAADEAGTTDAATAAAPPGTPATTARNTATETETAPDPAPEPELEPAQPLDRHG